MTHSFEVHDGQSRQIGVERKVATSALDIISVQTLYENVASEVEEIHLWIH